jgi:hypothetical protein
MARFAVRYLPESLHVVVGEEIAWMSRFNKIRLAVEPA